MLLLPLYEGGSQWESRETHLCPSLRHPEWPAQLGPIFFRIGTWDAMLATNWSLTFPHSFLKFVGVSARSSSWNICFLQVFTQTLSSGSLLLYFSEKMRSWIQAVCYQLWKIPCPGLFNLSICISPAPQIRNSWRPRPGWEHNGDSVFVNLMPTWLDFVAPRTQTSTCLWESFHVGSGDLERSTYSVTWPEIWRE